MSFPIFTIAGLRAELKRRWSELNISTVEAEAEMAIICEHLTGLSTVQQISNRDLCVNPKLWHQLDEIHTARRSGQPLQYILGFAHFCGLKLKVAPVVLIPRPETEQLIMLTCELLKGRTEPKILEVGTGSGCISIAIAQRLRAQRPTIIATDVSEECLNIARLNALSTNVEAFISFEQADILIDSSNQPVFDVVVSNPPYIRPLEWDSLSREVKSEPRLALVGSDNEDGLVYYRKLAALPLPGIAMCLEVDPQRARNVASLLESAGYSEVVAHRDVSGSTRYVIGKIFGNRRPPQNAYEHSSS